MSLGLLTIDCWFKMTRGKMYALSSGIQSHCFSRFATRFNCLLLAHMLKFPELVVEVGEHRVFLEFLFSFGVYNLRTTKEQMSGWVGGLLTKSCMGIPWLQEAQCLWMQDQSQLSLKPVSHGVHQTTWYLSPQSGPGQLHGHVTYRPVQPPLPQMSISTNQPL